MDVVQVSRGGVVLLRVPRKVGVFHAFLPVEVKLVRRLCLEMKLVYCSHVMRARFDTTANTRKIPRGDESRQRCGKV